MQFCKLAAYLGLQGCENEQTTQLKEQFVNHVNAFGLNYGTNDEFDFRFNLYQAKDKMITEHNLKKSSFKVAHNQFSTYTQAEYKKLLGVKGLPDTSVKPTYIDSASLPESVDWRTKGAVNPVKNQGACGSCWAFSATCTVEGAHFLKTGNLISLSEQQLVDCDPQSQGCQGGWQYWAYQYLEKTKQETEATYPYVSPATSTCHTAQADGQVAVTGYKVVPTDDVDQLKAAIAKQPTAVTIEADAFVFQHYWFGVLDSSLCGTSLDHAVVAVGYGTDFFGYEYYLVRNSWGTSWGDAGYIKIGVEKGKGICGIQMATFYPATD